MGDIAFPATLECSWSSQCFWGACRKFPAWSLCSLCAWSPKWPCPMPSPVSSTAVPASLPRQASTTHSTFLFSRLQDRVPMHHHAKAPAHEHKHTQMPICMPLTCALFHKHTHAHVHDPVHKYTYTHVHPRDHMLSHTHIHAHVLAPVHWHFLSLLRHMHTQTWTGRCPCSCTCLQTHKRTRELCVGHQRDRPGVAQGCPTPFQKSMTKTCAQQDGHL